MFLILKLKDNSFVSHSLLFDLIKTIAINVITTEKIILEIIKSATVKLVFLIIK